MGEPSRSRGASRSHHSRHANGHEIIDHHGDYHNGQTAGGRGHHHQPQGHQRDVTYSVHGHHGLVPGPGGQRAHHPHNMHPGKKTLVENDSYDSGTPVSSNNKHSHGHTDGSVQSGSYNNGSYGGSDEPEPREHIAQFAQHLHDHHAYNEVHHHRDSHPHRDGRDGHLMPRQNQLNVSRTPTRSTNLPHIPDEYNQYNRHQTSTVDLTTGKGMIDDNRPNVAMDTVDLTTHKGLLDVRVRGPSRETQKSKKSQKSAKSPR